MFKLHLYKYTEYSVIRMLKIVKLLWLTGIVDFHVFIMLF
jgi:hypothetical protein